MSPFQSQIVTLIALSVTILLGSAIATGVEAAVLTVSPIQVHTLTHQQVKGSRALERIKNRPGRTLALLVIANNLFNISGSMVLGGVAHELFMQKEIVHGDLAEFGFNVLFTIAVILLAEILPKAMGNNFSLPIALASSQILLAIERITLPLLLLLERVLPAITAESELTTNEREIRLLARLGSQKGQIEADEAAMIGKVFELNDLTARDLMVPRVGTPSLPGGATLSSQRDQILASGHAWWVVLGEEVDEVLGVLSREQALEALVEGRGSGLVSGLVGPAQFVPEMIRADRLLTTFRRGDQDSVRVVVDEFGGFVGLVSADAILGVLAGWRRQAPGSHLPV